MLTFFNVTQRGQRHIERDNPGQDFSGAIRIPLEKFGMDVILAAVADGVGSCEFSQDGSRIAVESALSALAGEMAAWESFSDEQVLNALRRGFEAALEEVEKFADEARLPFIEFDSTLTVAVYNGNELWFGHIGDDGIVALYSDCVYEMITRRHKGREANSVFPLRDETLWEFGKAPRKVVSFVMMTDGVLDYCVDTEMMHNRVYFPFLQPALTKKMETDEAARETQESWDEFFRGSEDYPQNIRDSVTDDITFLVVQNSESVALLPQIEFDLEKWEADTAQRKKALDEVLYKEYYAHQAQQAAAESGEEQETEPPGQTEQSEENPIQLEPSEIDETIERNPWQDPREESLAQAFDNAYADETEPAPCVPPESLQDRKPDVQDTSEYDRNHLPCNPVDYSTGSGPLKTVQRFMENVVTSTQEIIEDVTRKTRSSRKSVRRSSSSGYYSSSTRAGRVVKRSEMTYTEGETDRLPQNQDSSSGQEENV